MVTLSPTKWSPSNVIVFVAKSSNFKVLLVVERLILSGDCSSVFLFGDEWSASMLISWWSWWVDYLFYDCWGLSRRLILDVDLGYCLVYSVYSVVIVIFVGDDSWGCYYIW
jgi:hypothetical protein